MPYKLIAGPLPLLQYGHSNHKSISQQQKSNSKRGLTVKRMIFPFKTPKNVLFLDFRALADTLLSCRGRWEGPYTQASLSELFPPQWGLSAVGVVEGEEGGSCLAPQEITSLPWTLTATGRASIHMSKAVITWPRRYRSTVNLSLHCPLTWQMFPKSVRKHLERGGLLKNNWTGRIFVYHIPSRPIGFHTASWASSEQIVASFWCEEQH